MSAPSGILAAAYDGSIEFASLPADWSDRMERRIETGLLTPGNKRRANYVVRSKTPDSISFSSKDFWTSFNIGLNEVELRRPGGNRVTYHASFGRWAVYAAIQGLAIAGAVLIVVLLWPGAGAQLGNYGAWGWPYFIVLLLFFGLIFPRVLVVVHRQFAARALERIVREAVAA